MNVLMTLGRKRERKTGEGGHYVRTLPIEWICVHRGHDIPRVISTDRDQA